MSITTLSKADILSTIPHRDPFLFLKKIIDCKPKNYLLAKMANEEKMSFYSGHFPGKPIMPGVLIVEALAQAACFFFIKSMRPPNDSIYYLGSLRIRFFQSAAPKDVIDLRVENERMITMGAVLKVSAFCGKKILLSGELGLICKK